MNKRILNKKGFSLIELIVVIAILAALVSIAVPTYIGHINKSRRQVCESNIESIMRLYTYQHSLDESCTLEDFLAVKSTVDISGIKCPENGVYSIENGKIVCSVHGEKEGDEDNPSGGNYAVGDLAFKGDNGISVYLSGDWASAKQEAGSNDDYGLLLQNGTVYKDQTGIYVVKESPWLSREQGSKDIKLSQMSGLEKINPNEKIITDSDYDSTQGKWINAPKNGSLYVHNNEIYMCGYSSHQWTTNDLNSGVWIKLTGQNVK